MQQRRPFARAASAAGGQNVARRLPRPFEGKYGVPLFTAIASARVASGGAAHPSAVGLHAALRITFLITLAATAGGALLYVLGGVGLPKPDIEAWILKNRPAIRSPLIAQTLREEA
jgi:hypothetical protein